MRTLLLLLVLLASGFTRIMTEDEVYTIEPGIGINDIKLGMSYTDFKGIVGTPFEHRSFSEEKKSYKKAKLDAAALMQYKIGFDFVLVYYKNNNKSPYPIYKAYFKDNKLVYINLSSYTYELADCKKKFRLPGGLTFGASNGLITTEFGEPDEKGVYLNDNLAYVYKKKGVALVVNQTENAMRGIEIFKAQE
ncbi:MAG: hypothetical protein AB1458_12855 [Bacteroidota bacterium]